MGFQITTRNLPVIRDFHDAEEFFNETKPLRGRSEVPLNDNRRGEMYIHPCRRHDGVEGYAMQLFKTDVVVFWKDGKWEADVNYCSQSTAAFATHFATHFAPSGYFTTRSDRIVWGGKHGEFATRTSEFCFDCENNLTNAVPVYVTRVNKSRAPAARRAYAPMLKQLKALANILTETISPDTFVQMRQEAATSVPCSVYQLENNVAEFIDREEDWPHILMAFGEVRYGHGGKHNPNGKVVFNTAKMTATINTLAYEKHEAYDVIECEPGMLPDGWRFEA